MVEVSEDCGKQLGTPPTDVIWVRDAFLQHLVPRPPRSALICARQSAVAFFKAVFAASALSGTNNRPHRTAPQRPSTSLTIGSLIVLNVPHLNRCRVAAGRHLRPKESPGLEPGAR